LDNYDGAKNDLGRFEGSHDTACQAAQNSLEAGLYTVLSKVVTEANIDDLLRYIEFANELGVHGVRVLDAVPCGSCIDDPPLSARSIQRLIRIHKKRNRNKRLPQLTTKPYLESPEMFGCGPGTIHGYINSQGIVCGCDFLKITFGDLKENHMQKFIPE